MKKFKVSIIDSLPVTKDTKNIPHVSDEAKKDVQEFINYCIELRKTASTEYFYDHITEYNNSIQDFIHKELKKYGFKNGNVEWCNSHPDIAYWWEIYKMIDWIIYSPNLHTKTENHHSSAYERNEALIVELQYLINN